MAPSGATRNERMRTFRFPSLRVNESVTARAPTSTVVMCSKVVSTKWNRLRSAEATSARGGPVRHRDLVHDARGGLVDHEDAARKCGEVERAVARGDRRGARPGRRTLLPGGLRGRRRRERKRDREQQEERDSRARRAAVHRESVSRNGAGLLDACFAGTPSRGATIRRATGI